MGLTIGHFILFISKNHFLKRRIHVMTVVLIFFFFFFFLQKVKVNSLSEGLHAILKLIDQPIAAFEAHLKDEFRGDFAQFHSNGRDFR